jgi:hypothetical protein
VINTPTFVAACAASLLVCAASAQPINTTLPGGWSWNPLPSQNGTFNTGLLQTARGGFDGQTSGPYNDTSFGVMNEGGTPWFTGNDLSAQQYVQRQVFGNFGTSSPPGPSGARYFNGGNQGTTPGSNFPRSTVERRSVTGNNWNNPNPDSGGVATLNQIVYVPVSARLTVGQGFGADEMLLRIIGGTSGARSQFFVDGTINSSFLTSSFGGLTSTGNSIRVNAVVGANNAGSGSYDTAWGFGATNNPDVTVNRVDSIDAVFVNNAFVQNPGQGLGANSVGYSFSQDFNVLSVLNQTGSAFSFDFAATADINNLVRDSGNADARAQMGPGMSGSVQLIVEWQAFQAVPTPGAAALLAASLLASGRRRQR